MLNGEHILKPSLLSEGGNERDSVKYIINDTNNLTQYIFLHARVATIMHHAYANKMNDFLLCFFCNNAIHL